MDLTQFEQTDNVSASLSNPLQAPASTKLEEASVSLRPAGTTGLWYPGRVPPHEHKSGDDLNVYCHSLGLGSYANLNKPPTQPAPPSLVGPSRELSRGINFRS